MTVQSVHQPAAAPISPSRTPRSWSPAFASTSIALMPRRAGPHPHPPHGARCRRARAATQAIAPSIAVGFRGQRSGRDDLGLEGRTRAGQLRPRPDPEHPKKLHAAWGEVWSVGTRASAAWDANAARPEDRRSALLTRARGPRYVRVWRRPGVASPRRAADRRGARCAPRVPRHGRARLSSLHTPVATSPDAGDGPPGPVSHQTTPAPVSPATRCRRSSSR